MRRFRYLNRKLWNVLLSQKSEFPEIAIVVDEICNQTQRLTECESLAAPVFRQQVVLRLRDFAERIGRLAEGRLVFESTETWRTVYEEVLNGCKARRYLSVALIRSDDYWRDPPAQNSLDFNFQLVEHGFHVHRIFVIDEFFWPRNARTPSAELLRWIQGQRHRGIDVSLVRLTELDEEPTLVGDFGIYGTDAVGWQQTDFEGRTIRYEISFGHNSMTDAEQRWNQLLLFAKSFEEVVIVN